MTDSTQDPRHADPFLAGAYGLTDLKSAMTFYEEWAGEYDDRMEDKLGYVAPRIMAERLAPFIEDPASAHVLDVGCGTGLTSQYLVGLGVKTVDGVDITPEMLDGARTRGIYRSLLEADITLPLEFETAAYDAIISSGTFTLGHVGPEPLPELIRVLKPGGHLGCSIHAELWENGGFDEAFSGLEADGLIETVEHVAGEFFTGMGETARYCIFRKR